MADKPKADPPHGMEAYDLGGDDDLGALSSDQQKQLNKHKIQTRLANEKYLREHPEVSCMISEFLRDVYLKRPDNVREFAAEYFNDPALPDKIEKAVMERKDRLDEMKTLRSTNNEH